jgi:hypothetical protein
MKRLIAFDLDGTLTPSKQPIDAEMAALLDRLIKYGTVAVISGGDWPQFETQLINRLPADTELDQLVVLPTSGTKLYRHDGQWRCIYAELLSAAERESIIGTLATMVGALGLDAERSWGERIEDRGSQITFSGLGQQAPPEAKFAWDPGFAKREAIREMLAPLLPGFAVRIGGSTSVDITRQGVDKGRGMLNLAEETGIPVAEMLFIGDAFYPRGNDSPVAAAGVDCIPVRDVTDTKRLIEAILLWR